jgi:carboxyl-terminal processing protease
MKRRTVFLLLLGFGILVLGLSLGLVGGVVLDRRVLTAFVPLNDMPIDAVPDFRLMTEAWNMIHRVYVDRAAVKTRPLTYGAIGGMVDALGDTGHSRFLTPEMVRMVKHLSQGQFKGIGVEVRMRAGHIVVVAPLDGSPAQRAGLHPGDIILKVDGQDITGVSLDRVVGRISGPVGTSVTLTILNPTIGRTRDVSLVRASIAIHNVTWQRLPGAAVAHLRIAGFSQGVAKDLRKALTDIEEEALSGVVLDLRNNPGGLLDEAVSSASQFLRGGNVLLVKDAQGRVAPIPVQSGFGATDLPTVVLVNGGTASAAEIVAGALKDGHRASLVGKTTFGTGTVLREFPLSDGSALLLAVDEWLTPDGHTIWHKGITPNFGVPLPPGIIPLFPEGERDMNSAQLQASGDEQLLRALALLPRRSEDKNPSR